MDIINPEIIQIGNRFYRKNPIDYPENSSDYGAAPCRYYDEEPPDLDLNDCNGDEEEILDIEETKDGFRLKLPIASLFHRFLIGQKGETKKRIELETKTQIQIPRIGQEGPVVISGRLKSLLISVKNRFDLIIQSARQHTPFTHFLSFPLHTSAALTDRVNQFREAVLAQCVGERGIEGSIFQSPTKLHLTVGVSVLADAREVDSASRLLSECRTDEKSVGMWNSPITLDLAGLEYMNDDPTEVDVLYIKLADSPEQRRLQSLAEELSDRFVAAGLMARQYDRVKLHLTVMNTLFRKDSGVDESVAGESATEKRDAESGDQYKTTRRESFDARHLLKRLGDYDFGQAVVSEVHLSQRYSTGSDGFYKAAAKVALGNVGRS